MQGVDSKAGVSTERQQERGGEQAVGHKQPWEGRKRQSKGTGQQAGQRSVSKQRAVTQGQQAAADGASQQRGRGQKHKGRATGERREGKGEARRRDKQGIRQRSAGGRQQRRAQQMGSRHSRGQAERGEQEQAEAVQVTGEARESGQFRDRAAEQGAGRQLGRGQVIGNVVAVRRGHGGMGRQSRKDRGGQAAQRGQSQQ
jgi:hypothetical protein